MTLNDSEDEILERSKALILLEPVEATISIRKAGTGRVHLPDHDGLRTETSLPSRNGTFDIEGARDKTPYYLVEC